MLWLAQRCGLSIDFTLKGARISRFQNADTFGVSSHDSVLDPVMDHLHEMAGAVRPAMQVTLFGSAAKLVAAGSARHFPRPRREGGENRIETLNYLGGAANHHAITTAQGPNAAA